MARLPGMAPLAALLCIGILAWPGGAGGQEPQRAGGETVDVELKIVPFYATDEQGRPVFDLRPEEIELKVGGKAVPVDSFDRFRREAGGESHETLKGSGAGAVQPASRHVFLLFDLTFTSPTGLVRERDLAARVIERLPESDRLYLLVNHSQKGFLQELGPVPADARNKQHLVARIREMKPNIERLQTRAEGGLPAYVLGRTGKGQPAEQDHYVYEAGGAAARNEYQAAALELAESFDVLAANLRRIPGPKLLVVFSQGIQSEMYVRGLDGLWMRSDESTQSGPVKRFPPIRYRFEKPLQALADSGAMILFVNSMGSFGAGEEALAHMGESTGGLYLGDTRPEVLESQLANTTAAYYEAGFYLDGRMGADPRAEVEVAVRRPGVKAWAPKWLKTRETYDTLSDYERQLLLVDLVQGGVEPRHAHLPVRLDFQDLPGRLLARVTPEARQVRLEVRWPEELRGRKVDLYTMVLAPAGGARPEVLEFARVEHSPSATSSAVQANVPREGAYIWGVVAVDPASGAAYYKRLFIHDEQEAKKKGENR